MAVGIERQAALHPEWWEKGRRFVAGYILPKGPHEAARLDLQHTLLKQGLGGNCFAPLDHPARILDMACGSGIWMLEMARQFPKAALVGVDSDLKPLRVLQAKLGKQQQFPGNCTFQQGDALQPLPFADGHFSYTHSRLVAAFLPLAGWPGYVRELARVTATGGYVELLESPLPLCAGPHYTAIHDALKRLSAARFGYYNIGPQLAGLLEGAGLAGVTERVETIGVGKTAALQPMIAENMRQGFANVGPTLVRAGLFTEAEMQAHLVGMEAEMQAGITWQVYIAYGQQPDKAIIH